MQAHPFTPSPSNQPSGQILLSNTYYPTLAQPHVTVVTSGIEGIKAPPSTAAAAAIPSTETKGAGGGVIVDGEGKEHAVDVIVYATGFKVKDAMDQVRVVGLDGLDLQERYRYVRDLLDSAVLVAVLVGPFCVPHTSSNRQLIYIQQRRRLVLLPGRGDQGHAQLLHDHGEPHHARA